MKKMKKNIFSMTAAAALLLAAPTALLTSCANGDNEIWWSSVPNIYGAQNHAATLELGQTLQLTATTDNGRAVAWDTSNPAVATVGNDGLVTAVAPGKATITAYPAVVEGVANGNYVVVTVVDKGVSFVDDQVDQSEAE